MPDFDAITEADLSQIVDATGRWISTTRRFRDFVDKGLAPELAESFQVWSLSLAGMTSNKRLREAARDTQRWHHQIRFGGKAIAYSRTIPKSKKGSQERVWSIVQLFEAPLSERIDKSISWMDEADLPDGSVRLLMINSYHTNVFWLECADEDYIVVASIPAAYSSLKPERLYSREAFLRELTSLPPIQGVPPSAPKDGQAQG